MLLSAFRTFPQGFVPEENSNGINDPLFRTGSADNTEGAIDVTDGDGLLLESTSYSTIYVNRNGINKTLLKYVNSRDPETQAAVLKPAIDRLLVSITDENKEAVYQRMITERNNIAAAYTAQGQSEAQIIKNTTDKEVKVMKSEASASADKIIAEGEAEYMKILSDAYNNQKKADFYIYSKALDTARESLKDGETTLFLDSDSPIAQIFQGSN